MLPLPKVAFSPLYGTAIAKIIELSSLSYLDNDQTSEPHLNFNELLNKNEGVAILSGTIYSFLQPDFVCFHHF